MIAEQAVMGKTTYSEVPDGFISKQVAVSDKKLYTFYDKTNRVLHIVWKGAVSSEEVKKGYQYILELVAAYKPTKWLLDLREREVISRTDQRWIFKNIFPEVLREVQQNVFIAVILPVYAYPSITNNLDGDELMYEDNFLILNEFLYSAEAKRWLETEA